MVNNHTILKRYSSICLIIITTICSPIINAYEPNQSGIKDQNNAFDTSAKTIYLTANQVSESVNIIDKLIERYPLLDQIIQMILELLNTWLNNVDYSSVF